MGLNSYGDFTVESISKPAFVQSWLSKPFWFSPPVLVPSQRCGENTVGKILLCSSELQYA
jgi:hypothetical protein